MSDCAPAREPVSARVRAEALTLDALLACYARDFQVGAFRDRAPRHDGPLAAAIADAGHTGRWLRLPFPASEVDVVCAALHRSGSGRHRLGPPFLIRHRRDGHVRPLERFEDALALVERELAAADPAAAGSGDRARVRIANSRDNLETILARRDGLGFASLDAIRFLSAEQALTAGHGAHPVSKGRWGFSPEETARYSPELGQGFRLHYLLAHPSLLLSEQVRGPGLELLRAELPPHDPRWGLVPVHPWEAGWLFRRPEVKEAVAAGALLSLGEAGGEFFATSSVRTVYRPGLPFSLKLSLHVGITNSERTNHLHELKRGCAVARLLQSPWGQALRDEVPSLRFLPDEGYVALAWKGTPIDGTGTLLRANTFDPEAPLALLAAFCEPPLTGPTPLGAAVSTLAAARGMGRERAAHLWLDRYLGLLLDAALGAYERFGLALEIHPQNLLLELAADGLPARLWFRDNQGYYFRDGKRAELLRHAPDLEAAGPCILPEADLHGPFAYYLLVNNALGLIEALSLQGLCPEPEALALLCAHLLRRLPEDSTGFVQEQLSARAWPAKANLRMTLEDRDEARRPLHAPATYVDLPNPLAPPGHPGPGLIRPQPGRALHVRRFPEFDAALTLRALEVERDLPFLHDWTNRGYAKRFWNMEGPLADLEAFYLELLGSGHGHALVGEVGGRPLFVAETYWSPRDAVGQVYDVQAGDYGFHMLACPPEQRTTAQVRRGFQATLEWCFLQPEVARIIGEPDHRNAAVDRTIRAVGYEWQREVRLPEKRAGLYFCTRESFLARCPDSRPVLGALPLRSVERPLAVEARP